RGALEGGLFQNVFRYQRLLAVRAVVQQVVLHAKRAFLRVEFFARVECRTVLRAASALHAGERLQRHKISNVFAGIDAEILVTDQRRNVGEAAAGDQNGDRTQDQVEVLGM